MFSSSLPEIPHKALINLLCITVVKHRKALEVFCREMVAATSGTSAESILHLLAYLTDGTLSSGVFVSFYFYFFLANEDDLISALWNLALSLSFSHTFFLSFAIFLLNQLSSYRFLSAVEETSTPSASSDIVLQCLRDLSLQTSEGSSPDLAHQLSDRLMQAAQQVAVA